MSERLRPLPVDRIADAPREFVLRPDAQARAALAARLSLPDIPRLTCRFLLSRNRAGHIVASGSLTGSVVQDDVTTLEPFESPIDEVFALRFVPEENLRDDLDPDDPVDEVGYAAGTIDLEEAMAQQLALMLDPYPRRPAGG